MSWNNPVAYFATGVGAPYIEDAIYAINVTDGSTIWKHTLPAGLYIDNLVFDYLTERLFSIAFNPNAPGGVDARIVEYDAATGNLTEALDISRELAGGFVYGGAVSICPSSKTIYVGVDAPGGDFDDFFVVRWCPPRLPAAPANCEPNDPHTLCAPYDPYQRSSTTRRARSRRARASACSTRSRRRSAPSATARTSRASLA